MWNNRRLLLNSMTGGLQLNPTQVTLYREDSTNFLVYVPIVSGTADYAIYRLQKFTTPLSGWGFASNCWHLFGLQVRNVAGSTFTLTAQNSAWEYAYTVGVADDPAGADWNYYGSVHQAQALTAWSIKMDGVEYGSLAVGASVLGATVTTAQTMDTYLPKDKTTVIGASALAHTFNIASQLVVDHSHTFSAGYQIYSAYSGMMPTANETGAGIDTYKIGSEAATLRIYDNLGHFYNTETDTVVGSHSTAHPWTCTMFLPSGGPTVPSSWTAAAGYKAWFHDINLVSGGIDKGKFYINYVSSNYADRIAAAASTHQTRYFVS